MHSRFRWFLMFFLNTFRLQQTLTWSGKLFHNTLHLYFIRPGSNAGGVVKIGDFRQITGYISKTVKNRHIVSIKVEQEVVCALSNGDIAVDLECPGPPQTAPFPAFCTAIHSFVTGEPRDFVFGTLTYHSKSHPAEEKSSLKGAWSGSNNPF